MSDLLHSFRTLLRRPAFTAVVVLVLALGIGANTAIFSVVDAALLKPMPIPDAERVVRLSHGSPQSLVWFKRYGFQVLPEIRRTASFDTVGAYFTGELSLFGSGAGRVRAERRVVFFSQLADRIRALPGRDARHASIPLRH